jgi:acyl-CoA synthetase (NDP forming)/RimJ/RimL family protein N-acetyltransferase
VTEGLPAHARAWEADVVLRDGGAAHLRPITPEDAEALQAFHVAQSPRSTYLRFFTVMPRLSERDLRRFTTVDHVDRVALVVLVGEQVIGVGRYDRTAPGEAEVAFNIADAHQGRGVGSVLLEHLAAAALEQGVQRFTAEVLPENARMLGVFTEAGYEVERRYDEGVVLLTFDIRATARSIAVMQAREQRAEATSLRALLAPSSVVVVGAGRRPASVGGRLLRGLVASGYRGELHVVHPEADAVQGVPAVRRLLDVPAGVGTRDGGGDRRPVDLAVVAVPAAGVVDVVRECAMLGVRGLVVVSSGFAETGEEGLARQRELVRLARGHGMRVVGPNSLGVVNTDPAVRLDASLAPATPARGGLGLFTQSGALGLAVLDAAARRRVGVSTFVSAGNRADVSGNDCMHYWRSDEATSAVGLYLESVGNPRKFSRVARQLAREKPVVVVTSGTAGSSGPPGHAVRESRAPREALDALLRQAGVVRVDDVHQLFDLVQLLVHQPLPAGPRVGVVGNSDALAALAADAATGRGLEVAALVTVPAEAAPEELARALRAVVADPGVDAVVVCSTPVATDPGVPVGRTLQEAAAGAGKPVVACLLGPPGVVGEQDGDGGGARRVPVCSTPEDAVRALAAAVGYAQWRRRPPGERVDPPGVDRVRARRLVEGVLAGRGQADPPVALAADLRDELLGCYGVDVVPVERAATVEEALAAAERTGYPVALKAAERQRRLPGAGGLRLDVEGPGAVRAEVELLRRAGAGAVLVQAMAPPGVAVVVSTVEDPLFGPLVTFGLAGDASTLLGDVTHRVPPLTDVDVADLVRTLRAAPRLFGHQGAPPVDVAALEDLLARVSVLADDLPEVAALELSPVVVAGRGVHVLAAAVGLAVPVTRGDAGRRVLPPADPRRG